MPTNTGLFTVIAISSLALAASSHHQAPATGPAALFVDDFSTGQLDRSKWNVIVTGRTVNNEQQAYVDSTDTISVGNGPDTAGAENGALVIRARRRPDSKRQKPAFDFISGRLESRSNSIMRHSGGAYQADGRRGIWPAFWALGTGRWPDTGEMDIMENVGDPTWTNFALHGQGIQATRRS
jgi:beta-glucanase (GH16 family)